jgi:hypothetical protein
LAWRSLLLGPTGTISAPSARVASTLLTGALRGITTTALARNARAEYATPCAWLPLE